MLPKPAWWPTYKSTNLHLAAYLASVPGGLSLLDILFAKYAGHT